jgi:nucleoside-diphosphate-sugar epimerase
LALYETGDAHAYRRRRVLLTGAAGYIAGQLLPAFRERYDLRLIDVRETDASGNGVEGIEAFDLLSDEDPTLEPLFSDVDVESIAGTSSRKATTPRRSTEVSGATWT